MIFFLIQDFADVLASMPRDHPQYRILKLLDEAIRRDLHFINRHPTTLFQCLWNSCWWYDCPDAAGHYEEKRSPGECEDGRLHNLLAAWRTTKEQETPGFVWIRSLRPPEMHLGSAQKLLLRGHEHGVLSVRYSPDGSRIVSGSGDKTVRVWDARSGEQLLCLSGHTDAVMSVSYSPDGSRIVSGSADRTARVWDAQTGQQILCLAGHTDDVVGVDYSPDGSRVASGSTDNTVRVWDAQSGQQFLCVTAQNGVFGLCYSPDGSRVASGSTDGAIHVWDSHSGEPLLCLTGDEDMVWAVSYSPDGLRIVGGSTDGRMRVWDAQSGEQLLCLSGHSLSRQTAAVIFVRYSPDGSRIVSSGSDDKTVRVWDAHSGEQLRLINQENAVYEVCFSPDGLRIVSGSQDKTVRVWDADNIGEILCLTGHKAWVQGASCSSDGARILSASGGDTTVRVWDASTGQQLRRFTAPNGSIDCVRYSSDESRIILRYSGDSIYVWDADSGQCLDANWQDAMALDPIKAEAKRFHWCLVTGAPWQESAIETADTALAIAWFATCLVRHVIPASERTWGGVPLRSRHLYLITLEGAPPDAPDIAW